MARRGYDVEPPESDHRLYSREWFDAQSKWFEEYRKTHRIIKFGVADGYALYEVTGDKRYTMKHIRLGDCYAISDAHIRGLTKADIDRLLEYEKRIDELFGGKVR